MKSLDSFPLLSHISNLLACRERFETLTALDRPLANRKISKGAEQCQGLKLRPIKCNGSVNAVLFSFVLFLKLKRLDNLLVATYPTYYLISFETLTVSAGHYAIGIKELLGMFARLSCVGEGDSMDGKQGRVYIGYVQGLTNEFVR